LTAAPLGSTSECALPLPIPADGAGAEQADERQAERRQRAELILALPPVPRGSGAGTMPAAGMGIGSASGTAVSFTKNRSIAVERNSFRSVRSPERNKFRSAANRSSSSGSGAASVFGPPDDFGAVAAFLRNSPSHGQTWSKPSGTTTVTVVSVGDEPSPPAAPASPDALVVSVVLLQWRQRQRQLIAGGECCRRVDVPSSVLATVDAIDDVVFVAGKAMAIVNTVPVTCDRLGKVPAVMVTNDGIADLHLVRRDVPVPSALRKSACKLPEPLGAVSVRKTTVLLVGFAMRKSVKKDVVAVWPLTTTGSEVGLVVP